MGSESDPPPVPFGVVIVTHGELASALVKVVEKILGSRVEMEPLSVGWNDDVAESQQRVERAVARADRGRGVLVLTDMFGGTPTNVTLPFLKAGNVEIVTGVNLPMLVKAPAMLQAPHSLHEAADRLREVGQRAIQLATHYLEKPRAGPAA